ncbi:glycosyltransferase [Microbacterium sp. NPDC077663]|uniref:glycosyltransferase n=1 Tax=Microbacterium sp. NPDC077663 TaxID=3364189 RepID=UPI0037CB5AC2
MLATMPNSGVPSRRSAVLCAMPAIGHVEPMLVVARELLRRGWRVRMLTGARYAHRVRAAGVEFIALPAEADTLDSVGAQSRNRGLDTINAGVEEAFVRPAAPAGRALLQVLADAPADVVFHDMTFLGVQVLFAQPAEKRPVTVLCGVSAAGFSSRDTAPYGLGTTPARFVPVGRVRNAVLDRVSRWVLAPAHRSVDALLAELGAPGLSGAFFMDILSRSDLLAQFTVEGFEYPRPDGPDHLRFYGPMAAPGGVDIPLPPWWDELDPEVPLVHVTQGTVANTDFTEVIGPALTALEKERVQVVVTGGGRPVGDLPSLPDNAFAADYLPYDQLLPRTSVFVTNGGYGGLHHAMRYGVPIVVAGDSEDKVETSARVHWSGSGISLRTGHPTPAKIRRAVRHILTHPTYADTAARLGRDITAAPGAPGLVDDVETLLRARTQRTASDNSVRQGDEQ